MVSGWVENPSRRQEAITIEEDLRRENGGRKGRGSSFPVMNSVGRSLFLAMISAGIGGLFGIQVVDIVQN